MSSLSLECASDWVKKKLKVTRDEHLQNAGHDFEKSAKWPAKFYPKGVLEEVLTPQVIDIVLSCDCNICTKIARRLPKQCEKKRIKYREPIRTRPALKLFSILIHMGLPSLVGGFEVEGQKLSDKGLPETFPDHLIKIIARELPSFSVRSTQAEYRRVKALFDPLVLDMSMDHFIRLSSAVLPFINVRPIGYGASSTVFRLQVYPEYGEVGSRKKQNTVYAKKEIKIKGEESDDSSEFKMLRKLNQRFACEKHIIKMYKCYRHGDTLNILMPLADGSLQDYLVGTKRVEKWCGDGGTRVAHVLYESLLWEQLIGLLGALYRFQSPWESSKYRGYHSDLKPRNILVFGGLLVLTDFGHAHFGKKDPGGHEKTSTRQRPGTEAYSPPEIETTGTMDTKFDVYAMGCIIIEILVFVSVGPEGVKELEKRRQTRQTDFYRQKVDEIWVLHPGVTEYLKELENRLLERERCFFIDVCTLIDKMCQFDPQDRPSCDEASVSLENSIKRARSNADSCKKSLYQQSNIGTQDSFTTALDSFEENEHLSSSPQQQSRELISQSSATVIHSSESCKNLPLSPPHFSKSMVETEESSSVISSQDSGFFSPSPPPLPTPPPPLLPAPQPRRPALDESSPILLMPDTEKVSSSPLLGAVSEDLATGFQSPDSGFFSPSPQLQPDFLCSPQASDPSLIVSYKESESLSPSLPPAVPQFHFGDSFDPNRDNSLLTLPPSTQPIPAKVNELSDSRVDMSEIAAENLCDEIDEKSTVEEEENSSSNEVIAETIDSEIINLERSDTGSDDRPNITIQGADVESVQGDRSKQQDTPSESDANTWMGQQFLLPRAPSSVSSSLPGEPVHVSKEVTQKPWKWFEKKSAARSLLKDRLSDFKPGVRIKASVKFRWDSSRFRVSELDYPRATINLWTTQDGARLVIFGEHHRVSRSQRSRDTRTEREGDTFCVVIPARKKFHKRRGGINSAKDIVLLCAPGNWTLYRLSSSRILQTLSSSKELNISLVIDHQEVGRFRTECVQCHLIESISSFPSVTTLNSVRSWG